MNSFFTFIFLLCLITSTVGQEKNHSLSIDVAVDQSFKDSFKQEGRIFIFMTQDPDLEPKNQLWPNPYRRTDVFAVNIKEFNMENGLHLHHDLAWSRTSDFGMDEIPEGTYYLQLLWDQDKTESRINAPGNIYGEKIKLVLDGNEHINFNLDSQIQKRSLTEHPLSKMIEIKSDTLSKWWGKTMHLKASVLLPHLYDNSKSYTIRYNVAGYGGRYTRINRLIGDKTFMNWWDSDEAPQVITVFLDGEGPFGDSYQMDSDNSGPYGYSLIHELIPYIESKYRGTDSMTTRFVDGCSTGGWVSLGLQLYYPEMFNGVYSYSPDAIDFENYQLINIYKDQQAFNNEFGYLRPVMRNVYGEPMLSLKEFIAYENVFGSSDSYLDSGGQFSAHTALYSPKGKNGLPKPMFDPLTGVIDAEVARLWEKYDLKKYAEKNWTELGSKLQGKIYIWMGDMDHFYLNTGTRGFAKFIESTENPKSDAVIEFTPMQGHCSNYSHKEVLLKIQDRLNTLNK